MMCLFIALLLSISTFAQEEQPEKTSVNTTAPVLQAPKWRLNYFSYYYAFQGERAAVTNLYDFDKITARLDFLNVNFALPKNWSLNVLFQHQDNYIETRFPRETNPLWKASNDRINGLADTYVTVLAPVVTAYPVFVTADFGVSLPTGAIDYKAVNLPGLEIYNLAYNAQLGSGTTDGLLGLTAIYMGADYQVGSRFFSNIRAGRNKFGYRLGNQYRWDTWLDYNFKNGFTPRIAGFYRYKDPIDGFDETRGNNPADNFFFNKQINWDISVALRYKKDVFQKLAISAEAGVPVAQANINVDNTFVRTQYYLNLGLNTAF